MSVSGRAGEVFLFSFKDSFIHSVDTLINAKEAIELLLNKQTSSLTSLFQKYGNRDTLFGTDKITTHSYGDTYERLFCSKRNQKINMLEIGISGGFGLACYAEYFKEGTITGIDIQNGVKANILNNERIKLIFGEAHDKNIITKL